MPPGARLGALEWSLQRDCHEVRGRWRSSTVEESEGWPGVL